jgi:hypothetical protein
VALSTRYLVQAITALTSPLDLSTPTDALDYTHRVTLTSGTGAGAADMMWHDTRTLAASGTENLDLAGSLTGAFGTTLTFARIKGLIVAAAAGNTNNVQVIRGASNGLAVFLANGDGLSVRPGGIFAWFAQDATGIAITAGSSDILTITNSAGSTEVSYDIVIIGASA